MLKFRRDIGDSQEKIVVLHEDITVVLVKVYMTEKDIIGYKAVGTIPLGVSLIKMKGVLIWQRNANASYAFIVKKIRDLTGVGIATTKELM